MAEKKEKLFDQFPAITTEEWKAKVDADLKGVPFEKKLVWRTNEGFNVQPMYRAEDIENLKSTDSLPGEYPYVRGTRTENDWLTRQEIIANTPAEANAKAIEVLGKGVTSLGFKVEETTPETVATLLKDIDITKVEINLSCCPCHAAELAQALVDYVKAAGACESFRGSIDFNPYRRAFKHGAQIPAEMAAKAVELINIVKDVPALRVLSVNSDILNNAGAYIFQELGYALAWGAEWLSLLTEAGIAVDEVAKRVKFNMGI